MLENVKIVKNLYLWYNDLEVLFLKLCKYLKCNTYLQERELQIICYEK